MRVVLVDDSEVVRRALADVVQAAGHEVVGQAEHGHEGVEKALTLRPDVVVSDWQMPVMDGIAATRQIRERAPEVVVIAVTVSDDPEICNAFLEAGAAAWVDKKNLAALRDVLSEVESRAA